MHKYFVILMLTSLGLMGGLWQGCSKGDNLIPSEVSYASDIAPLLYNNCLTCHSGDDPVANLNLENYVEAKAAGENRNLVTRINDLNAPMPPSGLLSEEKRQKIEDWVKGGYRE